MRAAYMLLLLALFVVICYVGRRGGTIFTVTTFFDFAKEDHWATFCKGMDTMLAIHSPDEIALVDKWLVVNEWSATPPCRLAGPYAGTLPIYRVHPED
jgi:hypothetical protein